MHSHPPPATVLVTNRFLDPALVIHPGYPTMIMFWLGCTLADARIAQHIAAEQLLRRAGVI